MAEVRAEVMSRPELGGIVLGRCLTEAYDVWLAERLPDLADVALVAVGGLGRREQAPYSDLDLVLVHRKGASGVQAAADAVWYPIWDSGLQLDHSVRTVDEALTVAKADLKAMLGLLDIRHIAGDAALSGDLRERVLALWRASAGSRVEEFYEKTTARWKTFGEAAFLLDPDLKDSRGALRDWHALRALAAAQLINVPHAAVEASSILLATRVELHRAVGHAQDVLRGQEQGAVAAALGLTDDDELLRAVNEAGRALAHASDEAWRRVTAPVKSTRRFLRPGNVRSDRQPLARDVVSQNGEVVLALQADPWADPVLLLRAARVAAEHALPLSPFTLERLSTESGPIPQPWPQAARDELVGLLDKGERAIPVFEALDQSGLMTRLIPEWEAVRFKSQRNPVHRFTVDRHLLECAAQAATLTREVARPDLLLVAALLHDIGKGYVGDHSTVGADVAIEIAARMGYDPADCTRIFALVRHHLLLPHTAQRRDPHDPATWKIVTDALGDGSHELLDQLHALSIADAAATGPGAWSDWKAGLIRDLVARVHAVIAGRHIEEVDVLDDARQALLQRSGLTVEVETDRVLVAAPDAPGLLSKAAGVLALHSLDVRSASISTYGGVAVNAFTVAPRFGSLPEVSVLRTDLANALAGTLALGERLAAKERSYSRADNSPAPPPRVLWFDDEATDATIVELRAADSFGLLHRVTAALEAGHFDIRSARVSTLGASVVDAFYIRSARGGPVPGADRPAVTAALLDAARSAHGRD
ncbi:MAG: (Protein-PII) uridylyltransferase [Pseudonocardiales bacterium]|nr:(Protein-PII) uridylyltransferase [Pseudonocardiales bacterium]